MFSYFAAIVTVVAVLEGAQADNSHPYHFKVIQFFANMVENMEKGVHCRAESATKMLQEHSLFNRTLGEYSQLVDLARMTAGRMCPTAQDVLKLKTIKDTFEGSRAECMKQTECKDKLAAVVQEIRTTVQTIDTDAHKDAEACADENCKQKVYHEMHEKILDEYKKSIPVLRLTADQALSDNECTSAFIKCMVNKNSDNLRQVYAGIARLEVCLGQRARPLAPSGLLASLSSLNGLLPK